MHVGHPRPARGTTTRVAFKHDESTTRRASRVGEPLAGMEGSPAGVVRNAPRMKPRSPVVAPSASRPPRGSPARASSDAPNLAGRDGGSVRGSSDAAPLGVDDDALATAEAEAERLKERFAFATDAREREEALRSATEAQLRVNVMHAERAFTPEAERRAAASATRALAGARRLLAELAESRDVPVPSPSAATRASPARLRASPSPSRARARAPGETAASFPGTDSVPVPSASPVLPARSPTSRASPETSASPNVPAASPARRSSPGKPRVESPAPARRSASRALFPAFDTDERHAAAVRLQRIQRGRAARARVKAMSEARRSAARGIPVDPHAPPSPTREARERARAAARLAADRVEAREWARRETLRVRQMVERAEKAAICAMAEGGEDDESLREVYERETTASRVQTRPATAGPSSRASTRLSCRPATAKNASPGERAARAAARRLKLKMDAEAEAAAKRRAAEEARAMSRRRVRGPGEEAFYERLNEARKSREDLGGTESRSRSRSRSLPSSAAASPLRRSTAKAKEKATDAPGALNDALNDAPDDAPDDAEDESVRAAVLRAREAARALAEAEAAVVTARTEAKKTEARVRSIGRAKSPARVKEKEKETVKETVDADSEKQSGRSATRVAPGVVSGSRSGATARGKAYAERVREMEHRKWERRAAAEEARLAAEVARVRSDTSSNASGETEAESLAGAARADAVKRDAALYARDAYRRAVTAAFHRYYDARKSGTTLVDKSFERELVSAANDMPAFRKLHPRHLARVFEAATLERHPAGSVVCREGERGDCAYAVVGGELALFRRRDGPHRDRRLVADDSLWDVGAGRDRRAVSRRAGEKPPGSVVSAPAPGSARDSSLERPPDLPERRRRRARWARRAAPGRSRVASRRARRSARAPCFVPGGRRARRRRRRSRTSRSSRFESGSTTR